MHKEHVRKAIVIINCLAIFFMTYTIASSAAYTVIVGDDFPNAVRVGAFRASFVEYFAASLHYMTDMYFDWQGTYFAMFVQAFLSPLNNFGLTQLRIVMILNVLFFFGSLFGMIWAALGFIMRERKEFHIKLTIFTVILFAILDANVFAEIFFWYCGASAYCIPFSFALLSAMCFLKINNTRYSMRKRTLFCVLAAVFIFLASGGPLVITGTGCYIILLLTVGFFVGRGHKISVRNIIVLAAGVAGALVNVVAPGNFARHTYGNGDSWKLLQSVKWTFKIVWGETEHLMKETLFGVLLIAMIMTGIYLSGKIRSVLKVYGIMSVLALGIGYVAAFPVVLGYGGLSFPNRCYFILDVVLVLSLFNFAIFVGCCLDLWANLYANRSAWAVLMIVLFAVCLVCPESISDSTLMTVAKSKHNGSYKNYYEECVSVYNYLETCPEEDVVIRMPDYINHFTCFYFDEDENGWVNVAMAEYYHKNTVKRKAE